MMEYNMMDMVEEEDDEMYGEDFDSSTSDNTSTSDEDDDLFREDIPLDRQEPNNNSKVFPNPYQYLSTKYFSFDREVYTFMIRALQSGMVTTLETLKTYDSRGMLDLKRWRRMKDTLYVASDQDGSMCLFLKDVPSTRIACIEDWESIVRTSHCSDGTEGHQGVNGTLNEIKSKWCIDVRTHGIPTSYIKDYIDACGCKCMDKKHRASSQRENIDLNKQPPAVLALKKSEVDKYLKSIMIEHKTRLVMARSSKKHRPSKKVVDYICHRGGASRRKGNLKRTRASKKCGCLFKVQVETIENSDEVKITANINHSGHIPGSRNDLYHLPVHPSVMKCSTCCPNVIVKRKISYGEGLSSRLYYIQILHDTA